MSSYFDEIILYMQRMPGVYKFKRVYIVSQNYNDINCDYIYI